MYDVCIYRCEVPSGLAARHSSTQSSIVGMIQKTFAGEGGGHCAAREATAGNGKGEFNVALYRRSVVGS